MTTNLLFLCVANRVRSPFAEFYLRDTFSKRDDDIIVSSAGFFPRALKNHLAECEISSPDPFYGRSMSELTRSSLLEKGILMPEDWRSREMTAEMLMGADLVITALPVQKEELLDQYQEARDKIFLIGDLIGMDENLFFEEITMVPFDDDFWYNCEENPGYVLKTFRILQESLIKAIPAIIDKLETRKRK